MVGYRIPVGTDDHRTLQRCTDSTFFQVEYSTDGSLSLLSRRRVTGSHSSFTLGCTSNAWFCVAALMGSGGAALELRHGCKWGNTVAAGSVIGIE